MLTRWMVDLIQGLDFKLCINHNAIAFDSDIAKLTENLTGWQWVFDDIDRWLKASEERFFILTGEPGVGKSAITP
jgi:hypothetical protein